MTDLKTLKDLFINKDGTEWGEDYPVQVSNLRDELKQEAVKWANNVRDGKGTSIPYPKPGFTHYFYPQDKDYCYGFIMWFFNLTEEDLK